MSTFDVRQPIAFPNPTRVGGAVNGTAGQVAPSEYIHALLSGYAKSDREQRIFVILQGYFDESASEEGDKLILVAGYVHKAINWAFFSDEWKAVLDAPPAIEYFHMVEAENLRDQFKGWNRIGRDKKVAALADVIEKHQPWSIACSVKQSEHRRIVGSVCPWDLRNPFVDCFVAIVVKLAQWHASMGLHTPLDFIFDERGISFGESAFLFDAARHGLKPEVQQLLDSPPIFRNDKKVLPLQAADMLAWHIRRKKENRNAKENRPVLSKLLPVIHAEVNIDEACLRKIANDMLKVPNRAFTTKKKDSIKKILKSAKPLRYRT